MGDSLSEQRQIKWTYYTAFCQFRTLRYELAEQNLDTLIEKIGTNKEIINAHYQILILSLRAKAKQKLNKFTQAIPDLDAAIRLTKENGFQLDSTLN